MGSMHKRDHTHQNLSVHPAHGSIQCPCLHLRMKCDIYMSFGLCREMSQVVALVHKVKGTFRRNDACMKYMERIVNTADSHTQQCQPAAVELDDDVDVDFFDRQDLGVLNRRLRKVFYVLKPFFVTLCLVISIGSAYDVSLHAWHRPTELSVRPLHLSPRFSQG